MIKRIFLLFLIFSPLLTFSQKIWTLEECIRQAQENNLQVRQAYLNAEFSEQNLIQSKGNLLPTINGSASHNYNWGRAIDPFTNQFTTNQVRSNNFSLFGSITLFNGFQIRNTIQQSQLELRASEYDAETVRNNISLNVTSVYLQILFNKELVVIAQNQKNLTEEQLNRTKRLVESGKVSPALLPDLEAQLASEELRLVNSQNQLQVSYLTLAQLMNINPEEKFDIASPEIIQVADTSKYSNTEEIFNTAVQTQPQIKSAEYRRLASLKSLDVSRGRRSPRLTMNGSIGTLYSSSSRILVGSIYTGPQYVGFTSANDSVFIPSFQSVFEQKSFNDQFRDNLNKFLGFTLTVPILNSYQVRTSIARSKIGIKNSELNLEIQKNDLHRAIVLAQTDAVNAIKRLEASEAAVRASEEAFRNAERRLEVGLINSFDYSQVKNRLAQSQSDLLQARYDYIFRTKILDFYKGVPLGL